VVDRDDVHAAIEARRELGHELEPEIIDSFVERIERRLTELETRRRPARRDRGNDKTLALAVLSLAMAIPLTAIGVTQAGVVGLVVVWLGIVLVNLAYSQRR
jgi:hypothetical protein